MGNIHIKLSYMKFGPVVKEKMSFKEKVDGRTYDGRWTKTDHNSSP